MELIEKDGFFKEGHSTKYYIKQLSKLGCPEEIIEDAIGITGMKPYEYKAASEDRVQQVNIRWNGQELYYFECGEWGFKRIQIEPELNGYVDFGYAYND